MIRVKRINYWPRVQGGWPTGNGKKLCSTKTQLSYATCLAVAYFLLVYDRNWHIIGQKERVSAEKKLAETDLYVILARTLLSFHFLWPIHPIRPSCEKVALCSMKSNKMAQELS